MHTTDRKAVLLIGNVEVAVIKFCVKIEFCASKLFSG